MSAFRVRAMSPGAMVASVALVAALAGFGASLPGRNSVDSGDIKANAVKKSEIAPNSVGFDELRTGSVRGEEVNEASLAKVPAATAADTATTATNVGGKTAAQLATRWALVAENGAIEKQTGGFTIVNCYLANANCYIDAGEDVTNNGLHAQIAVANTDGSPILSGEAGVAPCGATVVACAPPGTELPTVLVVAPRASDGTVPGGATPPSAANAARFYVYVTGAEG